MTLTLQEIIEQLQLTPLTIPVDYTAISPTSGYTSDLLSCVMAGAKHQALWVTLQAHTNIVAVAALLDLSAVIITEGAQPDPATISKANSQNIILLATDKPSFYVAGRLWEMGIREASTDGPD
jgi:hypothetical protein